MSKFNSFFEIWCFCVWAASYDFLVVCVICVFRFVCTCLCLIVCRFECISLSVCVFVRMCVVIECFCFIYISLIVCMSVALCLNSSYCVCHCLFVLRCLRFFSSKFVSCWCLCLIRLWKTGNCLYIIPILILFYRLQLLIQIISNYIIIIIIIDDNIQHFEIVNMNVNVCMCS